MTTEIKTVEAYEVSDGRIYQVREEAIAAQTELDFEDWYEDITFEHSLWASNSGNIPCRDVMLWLTENHAVVATFMEFFGGKHAKD